MANSQIETTSKIRELVSNIKTPITSEELIKIRDLMYSKLAIRPYDSSTEKHEKAIRWKRTAGEILNDGYVYNKKACTDLTVLFIALCKALGLETNFVKLKRENKVHSVAEIKLNDGWYFFDVSNTKNAPIRGTITEDTRHQDWKLWRKGRDAWDIGLTDFGDISKID